jgi:hypothetical protein
MRMRVQVKRLDLPVCNSRRIKGRCSAPLHATLIDFFCCEHCQSTDFHFFLTGIATSLFVLCMPVSVAANHTSPLWRKSASGVGSRPRKRMNTSIGGTPPPKLSTVLRNSLPTLWTSASLSRPTSSKAEKASALITSAHLYE